MIAPSEKHNLLNFIGYGRVDAPVWFLGMEEAGGGEENLKIRAQFSSVMDLYLAHKALGIVKHHEGSKIIQPQWGKMSDVMLRLNGLDEPSREERRDYQVSRLGRLESETLLADLMPIPKPSIEKWDYPQSFHEYRTVSEYYAAVGPTRARLLAQLIAEHKPRAIIAYGAKFWPFYRELLPQAEVFESHGFQISSTRDTLMILTSLLSHRNMNGRTAPLARLIQERLGRLTK